MRRIIVLCVLAVLSVLTAASSTAGGIHLNGNPLLPPLPIIGGPSPSPDPPPPAEPAPAPQPPPPPPTASPENRWALVVGVTNYAGRVSDTVGGANDARLVRDQLLRSGWRADRIRLLVDGAATGAAMSQGLRWLRDNSSPSTFSLFHYSGHVKQRDGHEFLWPTDSAFISDTAMVDVLRAVRGTAWTSISGCEAAGFDDGLSSPRHLFTGSSGVTEKSYEDRRTGYSVWTKLLSDALGDGSNDANRDGAVTVQEAFSTAAPAARTYTQNQRPHGPQTPTMAGGTGGLRLDSPRI